MRKTSVLMLMVFMGFSGILLGQEHGFEIGGYAGQTNWRPRTFQVGPPQASPPISLGFAYEDKAPVGVRFNLLSQGLWGGELDYSYQKNTATLSRASYTFYPTRYRDSGVMPFLTVGVGMAAYQLSDEARARAADPRIYGLGTLRDLDKRFAFNYGAGVKARVHSHLGVRADFRHIISDVPTYGLPKDSPNPAQAVLPIKGRLQTYEASAGIYFQVWK